MSFISFYSLIDIQYISKCLVAFQSHSHMFHPKNSYLIRKKRIISRIRSCGFFVFLHIRMMCYFYLGKGWRVPCRVRWLISNNPNGRNYLLFLKTFFLLLISIPLSCILLKKYKYFTHHTKFRIIMQLINFYTMSFFMMLNLL